MIVLEEIFTPGQSMTIMPGVPSQEAEEESIYLKQVHQKWMMLFDWSTTIIIIIDELQSCNTTAGTGSRLGI